MYMQEYNLYLCYAYSDSCKINDKLVHFEQVKSESAVSASLLIVVQSWLNPHCT